MLNRINILRNKTNALNVYKPLYNEITKHLKY